MKTLPIVTRLWFAYVAFFRVLFDGAFAARVYDDRALPPDSAAPELPQKASPSPPPSAPPTAAPANPPRTDAALQLLALLQREGRLVDFLEEDLAGAADADIGAAARVVHAGCRKALREHVTVEPVRAEEEGVKLTIEAGFDPTTLKLTGDVRGTGPHTGTLRHRGWRARAVKLPVPVDGHDVHVIAQAEVEL